MSHLNLVGGKLKTISGLSFLGISGVSIPTTFATLNGDIKSKFQALYDPVKTALTTAHNNASSQISSSFSNIYSNWSSTTDELKNKFESLKSSEIFQSATSSAEFINQHKDKATQENIENINYYLFEYGSLIKSFLKYIPVIFSDSIKKEANKDKGITTLDLGKIIETAKNEKFPEFISAFSQLPLKNMTLSDADGLMEIFRSIDSTKMETFLKNSSESMKKQTRAQGNATQVLKEVFVKDLDKVGGKLNTLSTSIDSQKTDLTTIGITEEQITALKEIINKLKNVFPETQKK